MPSQSPGTRQAKAPVRTAVSSRACTEAPGQQVRKVASHKGVVGAYRVEGVDPDGVLPVFHSVDHSGTARGPALDDGLARPRGATLRASSRESSDGPTAMAASSSPANTMSAWAIKLRKTSPASSADHSAAR
ncbi:MAG: hypothetical protein JWM01_699 [Arthrobacter sp.]|nr:hypothetical protein [Arthrobacter sp.]